MCFHLLLTDDCMEVQINSRQTDESLFSSADGLGSDSNVACAAMFSDSVAIICMKRKKTQLKNENEIEHRPIAVQWQYVTGLLLFYCTESIL